VVFLLERVLLADELLAAGVFPLVTFAPGCFAAELLAGWLSAAVEDCD
jgi:hypothetical protein